MFQNSGIFAVTERTALPVRSVSKGASFVLNPSLPPASYSLRSQIFGIINPTIVISQPLSKPVNYGYWITCSKIPVLYLLSVKAKEVLRHMSNSWSDYKK